MLRLYRGKRENERPPGREELAALSFSIPWAGERTAGAFLLSPCAAALAMCGGPAPTLCPGRPLPRGCPGPPTPLLGPPWDFERCGARNARYFCLRDRKISGLLRYGFSKHLRLYTPYGGIAREKERGKTRNYPKPEKRNRRAACGACCARSPAIIRGGYVGHGLGTGGDLPEAEKEVLLVAGKSKKTTTGKAEKPVVMSGAVPEWSSTTAISKLLGKTVRRIQQLTQEGVLETEVPPGGGARKYRTCETIQRYIAHVEQKAQETGENSRAAELNLKKLQAEVDLKESQGQLHRLKTAIAEGKYISADQATGELAEFLATFKKFAMNIPPRMAGTMSNYADAVTVRAMEKTMRKELEALLATFSDGAVAEQAEDGEP